jgi:hypothetical protein
MAVKLTEWRCSECGTILLDHVNIEHGWIEVKCRKCGHYAQAGGPRTPTITIELRDPKHLIAVASGDWQGEIATYCRRCTKPVTLPSKRGMKAA